MNRSLKLSMLIAIALGSTHALAETLGSVHVKSTLSQPLLAEIPINAASPAELQSITVQLASVDDFTRAGIVGGRPSIPLTFSVVTSNNQPVIRITSSVAVEDPYIDLLLEVNGGSGGKIIREFAILLDPLKTAPVAAATGSRRAPARAAPRSASVPARRAAPASRSEALSASAGKGEYGPVKSGDTLSSIARRARLTDVSMNQMLLALKQANPSAFYRDNINTLKRGAILRIPTAAEAQSLAVIAAFAEVHRQNSDWRSGTIGKPTTVADSATRVSASSAPTSAGKSASDRLALVPATEHSSASGPGGKTGGKSDNSADGIRQELQRTQESLSSVQQQSTDLKVRLQDLTEINGKNVKLLSLKDSEIADLQKKLAAARKTAGLPARAASAASAASSAALAVAGPAVGGTAAAAVVAAASTASAPMAAPVAAATVATPVAAATAATPAAAASAPAMVAKPATIVVTPMPIKPAPVIVVDTPWYMQAWALAVGVIVVIIIVLLALLSRRRKTQLQPIVSPPSLADRFVPEIKGHNKADTDQNELLDQLAEHPDDIGLHLELVALYYSRRDVDHFEAAAEAMHAHITDTAQDEWQDVLHMGKELAPGHPLFVDRPELAPQGVPQARRPFDLDDHASDTPALNAAPAIPPLPTPPVKSVSEYSYNFDLTAPGKVDAEHGAAPARPADPELRAASPTKSTTSWDFDENAGASLGGASKAADLSSGQLPSADDFNDDPVDTKLDLARAYIDMGDPEGARAMLGEVIKEGSQVQSDIAKRLLETLN